MTDEPRHHYEDRRIEPRHTSRIGGVDRGSDGILLIDLITGNESRLRLVWFGGYRYPAAGVRGFGHLYRPASLRIMDRIGMTVVSLLESGRLAMARIHGCEGEIDRRFGSGATKLIRLDRTLILVDDRPPEEHPY